MFNSQQTHEFSFKMKHRTATRGLRIKMGQRSLEQVEQLRRGLLGLGGVFHQLNKVGAQRHTREVGAHVLARLAQNSFAERVDFAFRAAREGDLAFKKQVQRASEFALWA